MAHCPQLVLELSAVATHRLRTLGKGQRRLCCDMPVTSNTEFMFPSFGPPPSAITFTVQWSVHSPGSPRLALRGLAQSTVPQSNLNGSCLSERADISGQPLLEGPSKLSWRCCCLSFWCLCLRYLFWINVGLVVQLRCVVSTDGGHWVKAGKGPTLDPGHVRAGAQQECPLIGP